VICPKCNEAVVAGTQTVRRKRETTKLNALQVGRDDAIWTRNLELRWPTVPALIPLFA
jgi:hypothetical protein